MKALKRDRNALMEDSESEISEAGEIGAKSLDDLGLKRQRIA